ncbi:MAG: hypothetical protein US30_C0009G0023 [Candidatus Moranbacteria bacterium GW2011_GWF2_36_839]|nr:MAG: hypothetical protein US27_C0009G0023 [Candidatus Moranbacteria bacterium GW2011_GWF1_36_78]KKQ16930.1 MAG: hypothetical protein US30_C0009G0023 [Candidatus Moranbacteria bacterium GW2011_GWF2_36_839]HAT73636.1 hypothetical protein [Candidatus Moranbacteria bacterium]HBY10481.1 hypothetical protein [Candidatus Moranbacteria bacterium]
MNLQEFVKDVLVSIDKAVGEARAETQRDVRFSDSKNQRTVEFDIAVSVEEKDSKNGKAGIRVLQFAEAGGDISKENKNSTVSRIQFGVHIDSMTKEEEARLVAQNQSYNRSIESYN